MASQPFNYIFLFMTKALFKTFFSVVAAALCLSGFTVPSLHAGPHSQYPLAGSHIKLSCSQCHLDSSKPYSVNCISCHKIDIPRRTTCTICHTNIQNQYVNSHQSTHFGRHCYQCHGTSNWIIINDIERAKRCISCHEKDRPYNHFQINECNLCHQEERWSLSKFDHKGFSSCQTCHRRPDEHKTGKCGNCHDTEKWENGTRFPIKKYLSW